MLPVSRRRISKGGRAHHDDDVVAHSGRRALLTLGAVMASGAVLGIRAAEADGAYPPNDPPWSLSLGPGVVDRPYGRPSAFVKDVIRRDVPWLTATAESSVSVSPLQDPAGTITPNGLFFERRHAGRPNVDPTQDHLMIHGLVERSRIFTMSDVARRRHERRRAPPPTRAPCSRPSHSCARSAASIRSTTTARSRPGRSNRTGVSSICGLAERRATLPAVLFAVRTMAVSGASAAMPNHYGYGTPAPSRQIAGRDIEVLPESTGLPPGSGTFIRGAGALTQDRPQKTVGSDWPYATTLWDHINRAHPFTAPHTFSANDVDALAAYILNLNDVVDNNFIADRNGLPKVKMPNGGNFIWRDPCPDTHAKECMKDCADARRIEIKSTAEGKGVIPRTAGTA